MGARAGEFLRFCVVGTVGFIVDASLTLLLHQFAWISPLACRVLAFIVAATCTWALNRRFTFRSHRGASSWLPYIGLTTLGAGINVGVYFTWIQQAGSSATQLLVGVAMGSVAAMGFNFITAKTITFRN